MTSKSPNNAIQLQNYGREAPKKRRISSFISHLKHILPTALLIGSIPINALAYQFQILIDTNQLNANEAAQASRFSADGSWNIPLNSSSEIIDWPQTLLALNSRKWTVSEDNPESTSQVDFVSAAIGRMVDTAMMYNEDMWGTPLSDSQILNYAAHITPGFGQIGARITVHTRSYGANDPRRVQLNNAVISSYVSGAVFEIASNGRNSNWADLDIVSGCRHVLQLGKRCYLLMAPAMTNNYVNDTLRLANYLANTAPDLLNSSNFYIVLATYVRTDPNGGLDMSYISNPGTEHMSIEAAVAALKAVRNQPPYGFLDAINPDGNAVGWALDPDTSAPIAVHFYAAGPSGSFTLLGGIAADATRPDVNAATGYNGNHGYSFNIPSQYRNGAYTLYAYAIKANGNGNNPVLFGAPKIIPAAQ